VTVLSGVKEGEQVVVAANFLIDAESNLKAAVGGFGAEVPASPSVAKSQGVSHQAEGVVIEIDSKESTVSMRHDPVASLKWPAMTMEFKTANGALLQRLKPGGRVSFEFVERQPGEWVITSVKPAK
jgi:Cu(I)/Ag(I) efflux system membrane fusion protein